MGKKKGGKKSKIEGAQRSRSASKCEASINQPIVSENLENPPSKDEKNEKGKFDNRLTACQIGWAWSERITTKFLAQSKYPVLH